MVFSSASISHCERVLLIQRSPVDGTISTRPPKSGESRGLKHEDGSTASGHHELDGSTEQGGELVAQRAPGADSALTRGSKAHQELHDVRRGGRAHELDVVDTPAVT